MMAGIKSLGTACVISLITTSVIAADNKSGAPVKGYQEFQQKTKDWKLLPASSDQHTEQSTENGQHLERLNEFKLRGSQNDPVVENQLSGLLGNAELRGSMARIISADPEYQEALATARVTATEQTILKASLLPSVEAFIRTPIISNPRFEQLQSDDTSAGISATWTLYSADRKFRKNRAIALEQASLADAEAVAAALVGKISSDKIDAVLLKRQISVIDRRLKRLRELATSVNARVRSGVAHQAEAYRIKAEIASTRRQREDIHSALQKLKNDKAVNKWLTQGRNQKGFKRHKKLENLSVDQLVLKAKRANATIKAAHHRLEAQEHELAALNADMYPSLSLNADWETEAEVIGKESDYSVSLQLRIPLFQPNNNANSLRQSAVLDQSVATYARSIHTVEKNIKDLWTERAGLIKSLKPANTEVHARSKVAKTELIRARSGFSQMETALAAQNDYDTALIGKLSIEASLAKIENAIVLATGI